MILAHCNNHLVFPEWNRIDNGGLNLFSHDGIVALHHANLRCHLQRNHARQLKVMDLLLKTLNHGCIIAYRLRILLCGA